MGAAPALQWPFVMQVLQAGQHKFIYLELQPEMVASIARQAGFETKAKDSPRTIHLDLSAPVRHGPLLLFDAADPANLGWFFPRPLFRGGRRRKNQTPENAGDQAPPGRPGAATRRAAPPPARHPPPTPRLPPAPNPPPAGGPGSVPPFSKFPERGGGRGGRGWGGGSGTGGGGGPGVRGVKEAQQGREGAGRG